MQPRPICPDRGAIYRAKRHIKRLSTLSAEPCPLGGRIEQKPECHALAESRGVLVGRASSRHVGGAIVKDLPIVFCPYGRASPISATARMPVFGAGQAPPRIGTFPWKETAVMVAGDLVSHRGLPPGGRRWGAEWWWFSASLSNHDASQRSCSQMPSGRAGQSH
jgi:hypothetical protein